MYMYYGRVQDYSYARDVAHFLAWEMLLPTTDFVTIAALLLFLFHKILSFV